MINFIAGTGMYACQSHKLKRFALPKWHNLSGRKAGVILRFSLSIVPSPHLEMKQGRYGPALEDVEVIKADTVLIWERWCYAPLRQTW